MIQNKLNLDLLDDFPEDEIPPTDPQSGQSTHHDTSHANEGQPDPAGALAWCLDEFSGGAFPLTNRNNWLTAFALFCNERGVPREDLEAHALHHYKAVDFGADEIRQVIQGNYSRKQANHGSKSYTGERRQTEAAPAPPVPADLYDELPDYLYRCCAPFEGHERAVMLLSVVC